MRKVIVCNIMSLDGYYEGPGGNVMALPRWTRRSTPTTWNGCDVRAQR